MSTLANTAGADTQDTQLDIKRLYTDAWKLVARWPADRLPSGLTQDELVQEAVVKAWDMRQRALASTNPYGYTNTVMRHRMMAFVNDWKWGGWNDRSKAEKSRHQVSIQALAVEGDDGSEMGGWEPSIIDDPTDEIDLDDRMADLSDSERRMIELLREGYIITEAAEIAGMTTSGGYKAAQRAAKKMGLGI